MDAKITKDRLNQHLSYDWLKYIIFVLAIVLVATMLFSWMEIKIIDSRSMNVYVYTQRYSYDIGGKFESDLQENIDPLRITEIGVSYLNSSDETYATTMSARIATRETDVIIVEHETALRKTTEEETNPYSTFYYYVDIGAIDCLQDMLEEAVEFTIDQTEYYAYLNKEKLYHAIDTDAQKLAAYQQALVRAQEIREIAFQLQCNLGLATDDQNRDSHQAIDNLAVTYGRFAQSEQEAEDANSYEVEQEKVWGINIGSVDNEQSWSLPGASEMFPGSLSDISLPNNYAMGSTFACENGDSAYENLRVMQAFIARFA